MYASAWRSEPDSPSDPPVFPSHLRVNGQLRASFAYGHRGTRIADLFETGGFRMKFPALEGDAGQAIIVNTGGGLTGGDAVRVELTGAAGSDVVVTTQSAEKIYRSNGAATSIRTQVRLEADSRMAYVPQETILFSGADVMREFVADMPDNASLMVAESVVFGRSASREVMGAGRFADQWRIRRAGRLVFADNTRLAGDLAGLLGRSAIANGARAMATLVLVSPDAEERLEAAREALPHIAPHCAISAWNGMLVARLLSPDAQVLRAALADLIVHLRQAPMPRVWQC